MKRLITVIVLLLLAIVLLVLAPSLTGHKGYVLIAWENWTIETTVAFAISQLIILCIVLWFICLVILRVLGYFKGSSTWFSTFRSRKQSVAFDAGINAMIQGDFDLAIATMKKTESSNFNGINYLVLAQANQAIGNDKSAQHYLSNAKECKDSSYTATIIEARKALQEGNPVSALTILKTITEEKAYTHIYKHLYVTALSDAGEFEELEQKLQLWKKALGSTAEKLSVSLAKDKLSEVASKQGGLQLKTYWNSLPRNKKADESYRAAYVQQLIYQNMHKDAESLLLTWQKQGPKDVLFDLMSQLRLADPVASTKQLEAWIKQTPEKVELYSTLGHISFHANDFSLAEKVLVKAVNLTPIKSDLILLSEIKSQQGQLEEALSYFKQSTEV